MYVFCYPGMLRIGRVFKLTQSNIFIFYGMVSQIQEFLLLLFPLLTIVFPFVVTIVRPSQQSQGRHSAISEHHDIVGIENGINFNVLFVEIQLTFHWEQLKVYNWFCYSSCTSISEKLLVTTVLHTFLTKVISSLGKMIKLFQPQFIFL